MKVVGKRKFPPRVVFYGPEKIGKTTLGAAAPDPVFICTEEGADNLDVPKIAFDNGIIPDTWEQIIEAIEWVGTQKTYKTLVIDTWNLACQKAAEKTCEESFNGSWKKFLAYGGHQGYGATTEILRKAFFKFDKLRAKNIMVVLLIHEGYNNIKDPLKGEYSQFTGDINKALWAATARWADITGHIAYDFELVGGEDEKKRAFGGNARYINFKPSPAEAAGCRTGFELPAKIPMYEGNADRTWEKILSTLNPPKDLVKQVQTMLEKAPEEETAKIIKWLGPDITKASESKLKTVYQKLKGMTNE